MRAFQDISRLLKAFAGLLFLATFEHVYGEFLTTQEKSGHDIGWVGRIIVSVPGQIWVLAIFALIGVLYVVWPTIRAYFKTSTPKDREVQQDVTRSPAAAIRVENSSGIILEDNVSYGAPLLSSTASTDLQARRNKAYLGNDSEEVRHGWPELERLEDRLARIEKDRKAERIRRIREELYDLQSGVHTLTKEYNIAKEIDQDNAPKLEQDAIIAFSSNYAPRIMTFLALYVGYGVNANELATAINRGVGNAGDIDNVSQIMRKMILNLDADGK